MKIVDLALPQLREAPWNPNRIDEGTLARLRESIRRYGLVVPLVVRPLGQGTYEVLSGNQRLKALADLGHTHAPCLVVDLDDGRARLLAETLNHLHGAPDLGLRADVVRDILKALPEKEVLAVLPDSAEGLRGLAALGQQDMAEYLAAWERAQGARLKHLQFQLSGAQDA